MTVNSTRREFLKKSALLLAGLGGTALTDGWTAAEAKSKYKIGPWTGDDFSLGHRLRDGKSPKLPDRIEEKVDFVILGGGLAGLSCAHYLRDTNFLLLEQYEDLGGHARGSSYKGISYSYGASFLAVLDGAIGELVNDLGLSPIKLDDSKNAWYHNNGWVSGTHGNNDLKIYKEFTRLKEDWKDFFGKWNGLYPDLTQFPEFLKLDEQPMTDCLKSYDPEFAQLMDNYVKSSLGGGINSVSMLSGIATIEDIFAPTFVLPGGNTAVTSALVNQLMQSSSDRLRKGAFVWDVRLKDNGAIVTYGLRDGSLHVVECKHVIFAIPQMVAVRVARNLSDKVKASMFRFRYGSFLVANLLLKQRCFEGSFDNFLPQPSEVADITSAESPYIFNKSYKDEMGSVLTVYLPYDAGSPGRTILYQGNKKAMADNVVSQILKVIPKIEGNVEEVVLTRWGHAFAIARPQYFKYIAELQSQQTSEYSFAHSSAHGLPSAEAAVAGAQQAANRAKRVKISAKPFFSIANTLCVLLAVLLNTALPCHADPATKSGATRTGTPKRAASNPTYWPPALNNYYPDMELLDQDGRRIRLSSLRGRIIVVEPIGMSCPACQAFAGANKPGARSYANVSPQNGLKSFEEYLSDYTGTSLSSNKIVFVQLLLYSTSMQAPTLQEAQTWANTFGMKTSLNKYVLVGQPNMIGAHSYNMIPGFQLIDKNFVLRSDSTGHRPQNDLYSHFFPTLKKLLSS